MRSSHTSLTLSEFQHVLHAPVNLMISGTFYFLIAAISKSRLLGDCTPFAGRDRSIELILVH